MALSGEGLDRLCLGVATLELALLYAAAAAVAHPDWFSSWSWGNVPEWIAALATVGAVVGAWLASTRLVRIERERDKSSRESEERAQAERVAVWIDWVAPEKAGGPWAPSGWVVIASNASALPIYDAVVDVHGPNGELRGTVPDQPRLLRPGYEEPLAGVSKLNPGERKEGRSMRAAIHFRDAGNRLWMRDRFGVLGRDISRPHSPVAADGGALSLSGEEAHIEKWDGDEPND